MITPLTQAKERLTIPEAWNLCNLAGTGKIGKNKSPFRQDSSPSFSIFADGKKWKDFGTDESGSVVDFVAKAQNISIKEACQAVIRLAGISTTTTHSTSLNSTQTNGTQNKPAPLPWSSVEKVWEEGHSWLAGNGDMRKMMAEWRGWPCHWIDSLVEAGSLACPIHQGKRCTAFSVLEPVTDGAVKIGYHVRLKDGSWRFCPSGIRANPFWMGNLASPRLIILEGQWDAITLAGAAGWLERHEAWPDDVAVIGIRGASGTDAFLDLMADGMKQAEVLIIRDGDEAGDKWRSKFAPQIKQTAKSLKLFRMEGFKDLNEAHKNSPLSPEEVWGILGGKK